MKINLFFLFFIFATLIFSKSVNANDSIKERQLGNGWTGLTIQSDPFDKSKANLIQISKGAFTFRCNEMNMEVSSSGFETLSFGAELKYVIDNGDPVDKSARYSTYLGGSDMITDSRYYSISLTNEDLQAMKSGKAIKAADQYSTDLGWQTRSLSLIGFTAAYSQMCK